MDSKHVKVVRGVVSELYPSCMEPMLLCEAY